MTDPHSAGSSGSVEVRRLLTVPTGNPLLIPVALAAGPSLPAVGFSLSRLLTVTTGDTSLTPFMFALATNILLSRLLAVPTDEEITRAVVNRSEEIIYFRYIF